MGRWYEQFNAPGIINISCFLVRKRKKIKSSDASCFLTTFLEEPINCCTKPAYRTEVGSSNVDLMGIPETRRYQYLYL